MRNRILVEQEEGSEKEDILGGLEGAMVGNFISGHTPVEDLPKDILDSLIKKWKVTPPEEGIPTDKEKNYIHILKKIKPKGSKATHMLQTFGERAYLKLGRSTILDNMCYRFDYDVACNNKILSTPTKQKLHQIKYGLGFNHKTVYITLFNTPTVDWRDKPETPRYSTIVVGDRVGKPYAYAWKYTESLMNNTKIYGQLGNIQAYHITNSSDVEKIEENLARLGL